MYRNRYCTKGGMILKKRKTEIESSLSFRDRQKELANAVIIQAAADYRRTADMEPNHIVRDCGGQT